jgi:hypothetical protein
MRDPHRLSHQGGGIAVLTVSAALARHDLEANGQERVPEGRVRRRHHLRGTLEVAVVRVRHYAHVREVSGELFQRTVQRQAEEDRADGAALPHARL